MNRPKQIGQNKPVSTIGHATVAHASVTSMTRYVRAARARLSMANRSNVPGTVGLNASWYDAVELGGTEISLPPLKALLGPDSDAFTTMYWSDALTKGISCDTHIHTQ